MVAEFTRTNPGDSEENCTDGDGLSFRRVDAMFGRLFSKEREEFYAGRILRVERYKRHERVREVARRVVGRKEGCVEFHSI